MANTEFNCLTTIIGSVPHTDAKKACELVTRYLKDIPTWPQLPKKSFLENMYVQYAEGFPGVVVEGDRIYVDTAGDYSKSLETLYQAYLENDASKYPMGRDRVAGLYAFLEKGGLSPKAVKGCITGPLSWGITVTDENKKSILYHDTLGDAVPKFLKLKAAWEENQLKKISKNTIIFVDEPIMASYGSIVASGPFSKPEKIIEMINEVFDGISGLKGIHCCGNTDWSILLKTKMDILNFDAYEYAQSLSIYAEEVKAFIKRGGCVGWGIVPNHTEPLYKESLASLKDRLEEAMAPFTRNGLSMKDIARQSLLLPSCGLNGLTEEGVERTLQLLTELSAEMRKKYI
ncbi:MAG: methionine synthase [Dehalococcoidales bacterium]|nr:methionine synthase [Dehalococcoidales bacterium]